MTIYTDGSYNPATKKAGWAFITDTGVEKYGICERFHRYRNIAGELQAIMEAFDYIQDLGVRHVHIITDLKGAVYWYSGEWQRKNECTKRYYDFLQIMQGSIVIKIEHIPGHTGDPLNEKVDILAKRAVKVEEKVIRKPKPENTLRYKFNKLKEYVIHKSNCQLNMEIKDSPCDDCDNISNGCYDDCEKPEKNLENCWETCPDHIPDCTENCEEVRVYCESKGKLVCTCGLGDILPERRKE